jgi:hypothetical protein
MFVYKHELRRKGPPRLKTCEPGRTARGRRSERNLLMVTRHDAPGAAFGVAVRWRRPELLGSQRRVDGGAEESLPGAAGG